MSPVDSGRYFVTVCILWTNVQSNQQEDTHNYAPWKAYWPTRWLHRTVLDLLLFDCASEMSQLRGEQFNQQSLGFPPLMGWASHLAPPTTAVMLLGRAMCPYAHYTTSQTILPPFAQLLSGFSLKCITGKSCLIFSQHLYIHKLCEGIRCQNLWT